MSAVCAYTVFLVAPRVGAWIEIRTIWARKTRRTSRPVWARGLKSADWFCLKFERLSRPVWARGLKCTISCLPRPSCAVAPRVGAWIEIEGAHQLFHDYAVAPRVGAWIEITTSLAIIRYVSSRPVWARGLKYLPRRPHSASPSSRPVWARGLKCL